VGNRIRNDRNYSKGRSKTINLSRSKELMKPQSKKWSSTTSSGPGKCSNVTYGNSSTCSRSSSHPHHASRGRASLVASSGFSRAGSCERLKSR
jgi:hypothetical protein